MFTVEQRVRDEGIQQIWLFSTYEKAINFAKTLPANSRWEGVYIIEYLVDDFNCNIDGKDTGYKHF
jgi:hypothetical protein